MGEGEVIMGVVVMAKEVFIKGLEEGTREVGFMIMGEVMVEGEGEGVVVYKVPDGLVGTECMMVGGLQQGKGRERE